MTDDVRAYSNTPQQIIRKATRNIEHYRRLLAGDGLTADDQYHARRAIVHFVGVRFRARMILEMSKEEADYEVVEV